RPRSHGLAPPSNARLSAEPCAGAMATAYFCGKYIAFISTFRIARAMRNVLYLSTLFCKKLQGSASFKSCHGGFLFRQGMLGTNARAP
ncbi:MAG: hypothetical protein AAB576_00640, partial [Elusimicrobiota bacterium]